MQTTTINAEIPDTSNALLRRLPSACYVGRQYPGRDSNHPGRGSDTGGCPDQRSCRSPTAALGLIGRGCNAYQLGPPAGERALVRKTGLGHFGWCARDSERRSLHPRPISWRSLQALIRRRMHLIQLPSPSLPVLRWCAVVGTHSFGRPVHQGTPSDIMRQPQSPRIRAREPCADRAGLDRSAVCAYAFSLNL